MSYAKCNADDVRCRAAEREETLAGEGGVPLLPSLRGLSRSINRPLSLLISSSFNVHKVRREYLNSLTLYLTITTPLLSSASSGPIGRLDESTARSSLARHRSVALPDTKYFRRHLSPSCSFTPPSLSHSSLHSRPTTSHLALGNHLQHSCVLTSLTRIFAGSMTRFTARPLCVS